MNFSYNNRENDGTMIDVGMTVAKVCSYTPGGVLIFFPSYRLLEKCYEVWEYKSVIKNIEKFKKVFKEPKDSSKY